MPLYPYDLTKGQLLKTDEGSEDRGFIAHFEAAAAAALVADGYVASTNMIVGAYTLALTAPTDGHAHGVSLERTVVGAADTPGTVVVVGTDLAGDALTETIIPGAHATPVYGARAFATVTSITGVGWVISEANDTIVVGWFDLLGLPHMLTRNTVLCTFLNDALEGTAPTVTVSATVLAANTVDLNTALDGTDVDVYYIA